MNERQPKNEIGNRNNEEQEKRDAIQKLEQEALSSKLKITVRGEAVRDYDKEITDAENELRNFDKKNEEKKLRDVIQKLEQEDGSPMLKITVRDEATHTPDKENISAENTLRDSPKKDNGTDNKDFTNILLSESDTDATSGEDINIPIKDETDNKAQSTNPAEILISGISRDTSSGEDVNIPIKAEGREAPGVRSARGKSDEVSADAVRATAEKNAEKTGVDEERKRMLKAEAEYLKAYRGNVKKRGSLGYLGNSAWEERVRLQELEKEYNNARVLFAQKVNKSVESRLKTKYGDVVKAGKGKKTGGVEVAELKKHTEAVQRRYNRMVLSRDVIVRAERARTKAKVEALGEKGSGVFNKALSWYSRGNKKMEEFFIKKLGNEKRGKIAARGARILAFATIGAGAGGMLEVGHEVVRSGVSALFGAGAGAGAGKLYEKTLGSRNAKNLKKTHEGGVSSVDDIKTLEKTYRKGSKEGIESRRKWIETGVAVLVGVGVSLETANLLAGHDVASDSAQHVTHASSSANTHSGVVGKTTPNISHTQNVPVAGNAHHAVTEPAVVAHIDQHGEGADALFGDLKHKLRALYPDPAKAPPEAQHILNTPLHKLSTEFGFAKPHESGLMHLGDKLEYNPASGRLVFEGSHTTAHVLAEDATGHIQKVSSFDKFNGHYTHDISHVKSSASVPPHTVSAVSHNTVQQSIPANIKPTPLAVHGNSQLHTAGVTGVQKHMAHGAGAPAEASANIAGTTTGLHHEIEKLLQPNELGKYANTPVSEVVYNSPHVSKALHDKLVDVVGRSGVGPENNETLAKFLDRAQKVAQTHGPVFEIGAHNVAIPVHEAHLYMDTHGNTVAYGGDFNARSFVAYNWLHSNPGKSVLFPDVGQGHALKMVNFSQGAGRVGVSVRPEYGEVIHSEALSPMQSVTP